MISTNTLHTRVMEGHQFLAKNKKKALAEHRLKQSRRLFCHSPLDVRLVTYTLAVAENLQHSFNDEKMIAGK